MITRFLFADQFLTGHSKTFRYAPRTPLKSSDKINKRFFLSTDLFAIEMYDADDLTSYFIRNRDEKKA